MRVRHGYLYLADLNPGMVTEAGKIRPVLVLQSDLLNQTKHASTWIAPCTTKLSGENALRVVLPKGIAGNDAECEVMIDQSRSIDNKRFRKELKQVPQVILAEIKEKIQLLGDL